MRRSWLLTLSSVLLAALFVLALLFALAPREAKAQMQVALSQELRSPSVGASPATRRLDFAALPAGRSALVEEYKPYHAPPLGQDVESGHPGVVLAQMGGMTITFDFNASPQGWIGLPGEAGYAPAEWNSVAGYWQATYRSDLEWRGRIAYDVPYPVETLKFRFGPMNCGAPQGSYWNVQVDNTLVAEQGWAGAGVKTVNLSGYAAPYRLTIYMYSGCNGGVAIDDVQFINTYRLPADQTNAPDDCPIGNTGQTINWVGGPINTRTGNYHYSREDISIAALGGPLRFERSYNSLETGRYTMPLGYGWTHNYDMRLAFPGDVGGEAGKVIVKGCRGSRFRFSDNGNGTYTAWPGVWATLTRTTGISPTYFLRGVDQSLYVFTATGQLVEIRDPQGNSIQLMYSGGRLARVQDATGQRFLAFGYDVQGRLTEVRDPISRTVRYGYNPAGNLAVVTDTRGFTWTYVYTGAHLLYDVRDPLNRVVERTEYDSQGRAVRQWNGASTSPLVISYGVDGGTVITDPLGRVSVDGYYGYGVLIVQQTPAGSTRRAYDTNFNWVSTTDENGHTTRYTFNAMGLPERVTDALGNTTQAAYDGFNRLTVVTDALGNVTRYEYGQGGQGQTLPLPITVTDALGGVVINTYNSQGLLIRTIDHGVTTTYEYNPWGQRTAITDALGNVTRYEYDAAGRLITTTQHANTQYAIRTINVYDAADNLIRVTQNYTTAGGQNWQNTYNLVTLYEYDRAGNRVAMTDTVGRVKRNWYDAANRLVSVTVNYSPTVGPNYQSQWNLTTRYGYDAVGNQVAVTDTLGRVTRNGYDAANRLISTTVNYSPTVGPNWQNQWNITTRYGYDAVGNRIAVTDTLGRVTRYGYDALNRLIVVTDSLSGTTRYGYDALGRQVVVTDASGVAVYSTYDALGRLTQTRDALNHVTRTGYDSLGRRAVMTDANGVATKYEYDLLGRLTAVVENYRPGQPSDSQTNVRTEYAYNALGNRTVITDARGNAMRYTYDLLGRLTAEANSLGHTTRYAYDALGNRTVITDADGGVTRYTYDALSRLSNIQYPTSNVQYAYDALGNRTAMTDSTGVTTWMYDALGRPITISAPFSGTVGYRYDALGNRTHLIYPGGQVVTYTYDAAGRLSIVQFPTSTVQYRYDRAGRVLTTTLPNGITTTYRYDGAGRLVNLTHVGRYWVLAAYTYTLDAVGNRVLVVERVLPPSPPVYLPLVMKAYGGEGAQGSGGAGVQGGRGVETLPFDSPLSVPAPESQPFESPLETPAKDSTSRAPTPSRAGLLLPDLSLLLFAPLALVSLTQRKKGWRWATPLAGALLVLAVVAIGMALTGGAAPVTALAAPQPFLSPQAPPSPLADACAYPAAPGGGGRAIHYTYDPLYRLIEAAYSTGECTQYRYDAVGNRTVKVESLAVLPTAGPDLVVAGIGVNPALPAAGQPVTLSVVVRNQGRQPVAYGNNFYVDLYVDRAPARRQHGDVWWGVQGAWFGAGQSVTLTAAYTFGGGLHALYAQADTDNSVWETDEANNVYGPRTVEVTRGAGSGAQSSGGESRPALGGVTAAAIASTAVTTYTYDAANRLSNVQSPTSNVQYTWDNRGNLTSNGVFTYTYNAAGQMVKAQSITATLVYTYSGDGLLVARAANGNVTRYTWDLAAGLPQMLNDGSTLYVPGVGEWSAAQGWVYYLPDGLGSVRQLADSWGYVVQRYVYAPFGEPLSAEGSRTSRMRYTGEQWDGDVGLVYLRARWYDPAVGRFTTRDPFPGFAALPQTQHAYVYVGNNPVNLTDPGGEIAPIIIAAGAGAAIGAVVGGAGYVIAHPGGRPEDYLRSGGFWQAVGIGAASGAVAGAVGWAVPTLLPAAGNIWGAMGIGALAGALASGAGRITANALHPCVAWYEGVPEALITGGIIGGIAGGAGWWIRQWIAARTPVSWPARPHGVPDHWTAIQQQVERMAASGQYSDIFVNSSLSTATNGQVQSALRPDIIARTASGKYVIVEVMSPSQTYAQLQAKMQSIAQLLGSLFGGGRIIQP